MKIKTLKSFLILYLITFTALSQEKKEFAIAKVSYGIQLHLDKNLKSYKFLLQRMPDLAAKMETIDSEFDFSLVFNDSTSVFYLEKKLYSDNGAANMVSANTAYFGRIKQQTNNYITEELEEDFGKYLVIRPYQKWVLHDETKMIGDYLCFKATTFFTTTNPKGKIFRRDFTAWYRPQLPYKYGPAGYGNLPGLIMQLQGEKATYGVKKIEFYNEEPKKNEMPKLKRKKLITEVDFEKLAAKDEKRWQKQE
jgi:GLPGLI family protein